MENSPIDPSNYEEDDDPEEEDDRLTPPKNIIESIFKANKKDLETKKDTSLFESLKEIDKNPELDSEAPVEELSEVENQAIVKSIAQERLDTVSEEDSLDPETIASKTYLENILESGDPDYAFTQTVKELSINQDNNPMELLQETDHSPEHSIEGNTVKDSIPLEPYGLDRRGAAIEEEAENPNSLVINNSSSYENNQTPKRRNINVPRIVSSAALLDTLLYRRKARIEKKNKSEQLLKTKLSIEVRRLSDKVVKQENLLRQKVAKSEKAPPQPKSSFLENSPIESHLPKEPKVENGPKINKQEILDIGKTLEKITEKNEEIIEKPNSSIKLKRRELLLIASKVEVMGTNLRKIHESGQLSEKGLRRMIEVYLRGGDVKKALKRELLEKQIDFERDPAIRDQGIINDDHNPSDNKIDQLLKQRGFDWDDGINPPERRSQNVSQKLPHMISNKPKKSIKIIDLLLILSIIILLVIVLLIVFKV